jgi:hypothetical protein
MPQNFPKVNCFQKDDSFLILSFSIHQNVLECSISFAHKKMLVALQKGAKEAKTRASAEN